MIGIAILAGVAAIGLDIASRHCYTEASNKQTYVTDLNSTLINGGNLFVRSGSVMEQGSLFERSSSNGSSADIRREELGNKTLDRGSLNP
jgi:hypothetical protein